MFNGETPRPDSGPSGTIKGVSSHLESGKNREQIPTGDVHEVDGKWFMRLDPDSRGVEIPPEVAQVVRVGLWANQRKGARRGSESNHKTTDAYWDINCHKTVLYALGLIDSESPSRIDYGIRLLPREAFQLVEGDGASEFEKEAPAILNGRLGLAEIVEMKDGKIKTTRDGEVDRVAHSFLVGFDEHGKAVCFEKIGYSERPFRVTSVQEVFTEYPRTGWAWAVAPTDEVKDNFDQQAWDKDVMRLREIHDETLEKFGDESQNKEGDKGR